MAAIEGIRKVAVIGSGSIGASWAALFLANGLQTVVYDTNPEVESFLRNFVTEALPVVKQLDLVKGSPTASDITFTTDLATALKDADFVQENGPERIDIKRQLFRDFDSQTNPSAILATSSSGLTCSSIQEGVEGRPERIIVGHPFNPPHLIPLVEVVGGSKTSADVISRAMAFYSALGKQPIHVKREVPGHIANRLQSALLREVMYLVSENVATVGDIDRAMESGPGLRWGVMGLSLLFHLGGGPGGAQHMSDHLIGPLTQWWAPQDPNVTPELKAAWVKETMDEVDGRSYEDLAKQRDSELIALLKTRKEWDSYAADKKQASHRL